MEINGLIYAGDCREICLFLFFSSAGEPTLRRGQEDWAGEDGRLKLNNSAVDGMRTTRVGYYILAYNGPPAQKVMKFSPTSLFNT